MFQSEVFDKFHTHVGIRLALNAMTNAHDEDVVLLAVIHELLGWDTAVCRLREHLGCVIQRTSKTWANCEQTGTQRRYQVLASTRSDDGRVRTRHRRAMVGT